MRIELRLYASFKSYLPGNRNGNSCTMEIEEGTTVQELLRKLNIPAGATKVVFVNGVHAEEDKVLQEGDRVGAFPPVAGG